MSMLRRIRLVGTGVLVFVMALALALGGRPGSTAAQADKVTICHKGKNTITVASQAELNAHLAHGDERGACDGGDDVVQDGGDDKGGNGNGGNGKGKK